MIVTKRRHSPIASWCWVAGQRASRKSGWSGTPPPRLEAQSSGDDVRAAVDVNSATSDAPGQRGREIRAGETDVHDVDKFAEWRSLRRLVQQQLEILQPGCCSCLQRSRRNGMDDDATLT